MNGWIKPEYRLYLWDTTEQNTFRQFIGCEQQFESYASAMGWIMDLFHSYDYTVVVHNVHNREVGEMHYNHFVVIDFTHPEFPNETQTETYQLYVEEIPCN